MHITFSPTRLPEPMTLSRNGDMLTINGQVFDFTDLPEGAILPREAVDCALLHSGVARIDGAINLTLTLPHGANAPEETLFPAPIINPPDGLIELPLFDIPQEDDL